MAQPTILLVDDDENILVLYRLALKSRPEWNIYSATDGQNALAQASKCRPSLVVLDVMLPDMDGIQVCRYLRDQAYMAEVPIVMLSARDDNSTLQAARTAGANDYWIKPLSPSELVRKIGQLLNGHSTS
jgi:DNA-binding response OmpR family regulator